MSLTNGDIAGLCGDDAVARVRELERRSRQLDCIYAVSRLSEASGARSAEVLERIVGLLPPSFQNAEAVCARLVLGGSEYATPNFADSRWQAKSPVTVGGRCVGMLEVGYLGDMSRSGQGPFLEEERDLLDAVAARVAAFMEKSRIEEEARLRQMQLMDADRMVTLGTLVSGVAHEINNPNHFVMLSAESLLDMWRSIEPILEKHKEDKGDFELAGVDYAEAREYIPSLFSGILDGARRISRIVEELRDFARERPAELLETIDINAVAKSAEVLVSNLLKKSTHRFSVDLGRDMPVFEGNYQRLEYVIINLVQNACHALSSKDQAIRLSTCFDRESGEVVLSVRDEGEGMPPETLRRVTDPFFTTKRDKGGTGLGLAVSRNIVEKHSGRLVFSSALGQGTTAEVRIPVDGTVRDADSGGSNEG